MEIIGKLMFLFILVGGLGLGVSEIAKRDFSEVDIPFKAANDNLLDQETLDKYKKALEFEADAEVVAVKDDKNVEVPDKLWSGTVNGNYVDSEEAIELANNNSAPELRSQMLYWHKKYHKALQSNSQLVPQLLRPPASFQWEACGKNRWPSFDAESHFVQARRA